MASLSIHRIHFPLHNTSDLLDTMLLNLLTILHDFHLFFLAGRLGPGRHADDTIYPSQRDNAESPDKPDVQRSPVLVPAHPGGGGKRPGLVHVPGQHRPDAVPEGLPAGRR